MQEQTKTLFPPSYLGRGSRDTGIGGPVRWLQNLLISMGTKELVANGVYDEATTRWISLLQGKCGAANRSGDFGLEIRKLLAQKKGIDVSLILISPDAPSGPVVLYTETEGGVLKEWPEQAEGKITLLHK